MKFPSPKAPSPYSFLGLAWSLLLPIASRASATAPQLALRTALSPGGQIYVSPDPTPAHSRDLSGAGLLVLPPLSLRSQRSVGQPDPRAHWLLSLCGVGSAEPPFSPSNWPPPVCINWAREPARPVRGVWP